MTVPFHGATPEKPQVDTDDVSIYAYEWLLDGRNLSSFEAFEGGRTYTLKVRVTTLGRFAGNVTVKVNNRAATVRKLEYNNTHVLFEIDFFVTPSGYTLSFDPGLGSGTMAPLTGNTTYVLPACTFTPPSGKEFNCWRVGDTNNLYQPGEYIILTENTTVRAVWVAPSGKTRISDVEGSSNIASIAVLYGVLRSPDITVTKGAPARILNSAGNLQWQKKVNGTWQTQTSGRFTAGQWRIQTQLRIDGDAAQQYELGNPTTLTVDGAAWSMANNGSPNVHYDYSMIAVTSPSIYIQDDPTIQPPESVTKAALTVTGYTLGAKAKNARVTCDHPGVIVADVQFVAMEDTNNDNIPDSTAPAESFKAGVFYAIAFKLKAKDGYDISTLGITGVTCNNAGAMGSYNVQDNCYTGMGELAPFDTCTVSFSAGGGKGSMAAVTVEKGAYTLPKNSFTAPEGKRFKTWSVAGKEHAPGSNITVSGNITVTANWEDIPKDHICNLEKVDKVEPTCTENGMKAYFRCEGCGKFYEDAAGKAEITDLAAWGTLEMLLHKDEDQDGKCDACGYDPDLTPVPITPIAPSEATDPTEPEKSDGSEPSQPGATESAPTEQPVQPTKSATNDDDGPNWLLIALLGVAVFALAVTAAVLILKKKK